MVDLCRTCNDDISVEYKQQENIMLGLQMALEGFSRKAGATDVTVNPTTLCSCCVPRLLACVLHFHLGTLYLFQHADHDLQLIHICQEANSFKQFDKDVEG
jgi:hypothetical protein